MKRTGVYIVVSAALAALGAIVLVSAMFERRIANAEERLGSLQVVEAGTAYGEIEHAFRYARYLPWVGGSGVERLRARAAAASYWAHDYDDLTTIASDANAGQTPDPELLFIAGNAIFRVGQQRASNPQEMIRTIDAARGAYQAALKAAVRHPDAAFNYEYVSLLRNELTKVRPQRPGASRRDPDPSAPTPATLHGREGATPPPQSGDKFNIRVPEEPADDAKGKEPGSEQPFRRKG